MPSYSINHRGFSLIELLITLAISAVLFIPIISLILGSNKSVSQLEAQADLGVFRSAIISAFTHPNAVPNPCAVMLETAGNLTVFNINKASLPAGLPLNLTLNNGTIKIVSPPSVPAPTPQPIANFPVAYEYIIYRDAQFVSNDPDFPGNSLYLGTVDMKLDGLTNSTAKGGLIPSPVRTIGSVLLSVTTANSISSCKVVTDIKDVCTSLGGVPNPSAPPPTCQTTFPCPPNQAFAGNDSSGNPICDSVPLATCPVGQGITLNASGGVVCKTP